MEEYRGEKQQSGDPHAVRDQNDGGAVEQRTKIAAVEPLSTPEIVISCCMAFHFAF